MCYLYDGVNMEEVIIYDDKCHSKHHHVMQLP